MRLRSIQPLCTTAHEQHKSSFLLGEGSTHAGDAGRGFETNWALESMGTCAKNALRGARFSATTPLNVPVRKRGTGSGKGVTGSAGYVPVLGSGAGLAAVGSRRSSTQVASSVHPQFETPWDTQR
jgi:hypothetical protein